LSRYENGEPMAPEVAGRLITFAQDTANQELTAAV
jgi:hypothetical protein